MTRQVRYLTISDIHINQHRKNTTKEIIRNLDVFFSYYNRDSQFVDMDIIYIAGDLFDSLSSLADEESHEILLWLYRLMSFCSEFSIKLRILEGTPSHDWKQSKLADSIYQILVHRKISLDYKYISTLHIEYITDLELYVLYVPDEYSPEVATTFSHVQQLLSDTGIRQVDIAIMHGAFGFQLKQAPSYIQRHREEDYLAIVKHYINIGHVHGFMIYDRIIGQGSFDRNGHGEEEPKGGTICTIRSPTGDSFVFVENKGAKIFKTITLKTLDLDKCIAHIVKLTKNLPVGSFVRIKATKDHPIYSAFKDLESKFPLLRLSKLSSDKETEEVKSVSLDTDIYTPVSITDTNIVSLLMSEIRSKYNLTDSKLNMLSELLESTHA
jgi:hypothetical protein